MAFAVGLAAPHPARNRDAMVPLTYTVTSPAWMNSTSGFYAAASEPWGEAAQLTVIEKFAGKLLGEVVEPPQAAVDLLNKRFWDLV